MRVGVFANQFPVLSETFVRDHVVGMVESGHRVEIHAARPTEPLSVAAETSLVPAQGEHSHPSVPQQRVRRVLAGLPLLLQLARRDPRVALRALNVVEYGREAGSLNILYLAAALGTPRVYDVLHCHFGPVGLRALALRDMGLVRGKLVTHFHGYDVSSYVREHGPRVYKRLFERGELFIAVSQRMRLQLVELGADPGKIVIHPYSVDCSLFKPRSVAREQSGALEVLSVARLVEKKGLAFGLTAVAEVIRAGRELHYTIVGDGPQRADLVDLAHSLGISQHVTFAGAGTHEAVRRHLEQSDALLVPSVTSRSGDQEGAPVVILEGMAAGLPIVSTRHSAIPELVRDGENGFLADEGDAGGLARGLRHLSESARLRHEMGAKGREFVLQTRERNLLLQRLLSIYRDLLGA